MMYLQYAKSTICGKERPELVENIWLRLVNAKFPVGLQTLEFGLACACVGES
jgi:hypothetical protein